MVLNPVVQEDTLCEAQSIQPNLKSTAGLSLFNDRESRWRTGVDKYQHPTTLLYASL